METTSCGYGVENMSRLLVALKEGRYGYTYFSASRDTLYRKRRLNFYNVKILGTINEAIHGYISFQSE